MNVNVNDTVQYDAFISYRHCEIDQFVAKELHKQLETFKIPKKIAKKCGKKRINRIFRDQDELPLASNLADPIMDALRASEFLIVICSPRLKESMWCQREIENFIEMHGQEKVLAVLVEGEPKDSFPEQLLYRVKTITFEDGETRTIKEPTEPLAADVRGKTKKQIRNQIRTELLRLLAPMLQCSYDDLKQRHKERRFRRILTLASCIGVVGVTFGTISTVMAMQISQQKQQIDSQYWEALETNAVMKADKAITMLEKGDRIGAIELASSILPTDLSNQDIPYTAEAFYALTSSVQMYATGETLVPVFQIKENAEIYYMSLSPDRELLCLCTKYGKLTVWDVSAKEKCLETVIAIDGYLSDYDYKITFAGNDKIACINQQNIQIYNLFDNPEGTVSKNIDCGNFTYPSEIYSSSDGKYIMAVLSDSVCAYDTENGQLVSTFPFAEGMDNVLNSVVVCGNDRLLYCEQPDFFNQETSVLSLHYVNVQTGEEITQFDLPDGMLAQADISDGKLYVAINEEIDIKEKLYGNATIYCYDLNTGEKLWEFCAEDEYVTSIVVPYQGYECCLFESYAQITALKAVDGTLVGRYSYGSDIVNIFPLVTKDSYLVYTKDGIRVTLRPLLDVNMEIAGVFVPATNNIKQFEWGDDFMAALPGSSKEVIVYDWYQAENMETLNEFDEGCQWFVLSDDEKYAAIESYQKTIYIWNMETGELVAQFEPEDYSDSLTFTKDNQLQQVSYKGVTIYNLQGELVESYELSQDYKSIEQVSADGIYAFSDDLDNIYAINCESAKVERTLSKEQCGLTGKSTYTFSNKADKCVILDKIAEQCRMYETQSGTELCATDMNATYVNKVLFSECDKYVYVIYEDGLVEQYDSTNMQLLCTIEGINEITNVIYQKTFNDTEKYYFESTNGTYILGNYDGKLKIEQYIPKMVGVSISTQTYILFDNKSMITFPIYSYEEILGKAHQICYDNSLWNNN